MILAARQQVLGLAGQVIFAAPTVITSIFVARAVSINIVDDLALAFSVSSTLFTIFSFGLRAHLGLWAFERFSLPAFVANRVTGLLLGSLGSILVLLPWISSTAIIFVVVLLKMADAVGDLEFGIQLAKESTGRAFLNYIYWSLIRLVVFLLVLTVGQAVFNASDLALLAAAITQAIAALALFAPRVVRAMPEVRWSETYRLGRTSLPLSISAVCCAFLTTTPRASVDHIYKAPFQGYAGIVFIIGTFFGMAYNTVWIRSSKSMARVGIPRGIRGLFMEGAILTMLFFLALFVLRRLVALVYGIHDPAFDTFFVPLGAAFAVFMFAMSTANLLKAVDRPSFESLIYLGGAAILWLVARLTLDLRVALVLSAIAMFGVVLLLVRGRDTVESA